MWGGYENRATLDLLGYSQSLFQKLLHSERNEL